MQVKVFFSQGEGPSLEAEINAWLKDRNIEINHVLQSYVHAGQNAFHTLISIWYIPSFREASPI